MIAGACLRRRLEQVAHARRADADEHLHEVGAGDRDERHARFTRDARAMSVLPVPGGPTSSTPFGMRAPISLNLPGSFKKSTTSVISSFTAP